MSKKPVSAFHKTSSGLISPKIKPIHLDRLAIVYVRQSTPQQILDHKESTQRQYALKDYAVALGWPAERVLVIDEDQGQSGSSSLNRLGFQRLLAEVGLDHVGLILGIEMSRLARSCKDWHQLLELCGIFRTLLGDQDGIYDPTEFNDRLLLGLKGTMSEAELHILKGRMRQGMLNKVKRGEVFVGVPIGYLKVSRDEIVIDPDQQAQDVVRLVFDQFDRLGTIRKVSYYLREKGIKIGVRPPGTNQLEWREASNDAVRTILTHPIYAGYYRYGYRQRDPRRHDPSKPGGGKRVMSPDEYLALIPDRCPAYITKDRYEANQKRIAENRSRLESKGAPREGSSLLAGLVVCGRCGRRMSVHYSGKYRILRYTCMSGKEECPRPCTHGFAGRCLDQMISEQVLTAMKPGALEMSLAAAKDVLKERERLEKNWCQRLERAQYEVTLAERRYQAVDPENRLVARTLEQAWERALENERALQEEHARFRQTQSGTLNPREMEEVRALAQDLPALWKAATTTAADRQRIIRFLVQRVVVNVQGTSDKVSVTLEWIGGHCTSHEITRPVLRYQQQEGFDVLLKRIRDLRKAGLSYADVANQLNAEGYRPTKQIEKFNGDLVSLIVRKNTPGWKPTLKASRELLKKNEWFVLDLSEKLGIPKNTLHAWMRRGRVHFRRLKGYRAPIICWADKDELARLRKLYEAPHGWWDPPLPKELVTPKRRPKGK